MGRRNRKTAKQKGNVLKLVRLPLVILSIHVASLVLLAGCESSATREKVVPIKESATSSELKLLKVQLQEKFKELL